jgi:aminopeptidase N
MGGVPTLTMQEAAERSALVTVDRYDLDVDLTGGDETFSSTTTVQFTVAAPGAETFVEVRPVRLRRARLNGVDLDPGTLRDGRLPLPGLAAGANELVVEAEFAYSRASEGMHRFVDPADGEVYVYAQPSIAQAPAFMACFDQPDLKAPVWLRVTADPRWRVAANGEGKQVAEGRWEFAPTPPLPTYLVTLVAGPYHERVSEHDGIPLALLARASLAADLDRDAAELFEVTAACLDRYHELFDIRYPFGAYRQVFVPEFSWGAMEFPGCVLIRDELVFRSAVTDTERESRAALIAHEMAHMWFGDLVTMRWWDDLWLNESFADYLGWRVTAEATRWRDAWSTYSVGRKVWGYAADQRPSTHPVAAAHVPDTAAALTNFDGISYAKGSAVLRQLVAWVGDEAFRAGLRRYFRDHAYGNATLADLLTCLSESSGRDLSAWARVWLREPQVNTLRPRVRTTAVGDRYVRVEIAQEAPPGHPTLRPHQVTLGLYDRRGGAVVRRRSVPLEVAGATTPVPELAGEPAADLLLVNDGDLTYAKVRLHHRGDLAELLSRLSDPLARAVVWTSAWDACRDAELPPDDFVALVAAALPAETRIPVFETVLGLTTGVADRYLPPESRRGAYRRLREACRRVLAAAPPASARQLAAARGLVACAGAADVTWLSAWLEGRDVPDGLVVDADLRWAVLYRLAVHGAVDADRIDAEQRRDPTARGVVEATRCRAALPDEAAKQRAWRIVTTDREHSNRVVVATAEGFWQPEQAALTAPYVPRYFAEIAEGARWRTDQLLAAVARAAYPAYAVDPATVRAAEEFLARDDLHPGVRRAVVDATDDLRRALAARRSRSAR